MRLVLAIVAALSAASWATPANAKPSTSAQPLATSNPVATDEERFLQWVNQSKRLEEHPTSLGYHPSWRLFDEVATLMQSYPGVIRPEQIGTSVKDQPIWAFHIQAPTATPSQKVLIFAGIHALEWISTEVALATLQHAVRHPAPDTKVTIIPLLNPDGRRRSERDLSKGETRRYRRANANNIDLNRDFEVHTEAKAIWRKVIPAYYGHSKEPLSQPETKALDGLANRERYDRSASLHAFGGYFYFPWSGRFSRPEDHATFVHIGRQMEQAQGTHAYRTRQLARWGFFFRAQGSEMDHLYGKYGTLSFLVELTRSGFDIQRPLKSYRTPFRWYNPKNPRPHIQRGLAAMRALIEHRATANPTLGTINHDPTAGNHDP